jgi:hypothetical protein
MWIWSPGHSGIDVTSTPLTSVPFREPRSRSWQVPSERVSSTWSRDSAGSLM